MYIEGLHNGLPHSRTKIKLVTKFLHFIACRCIVSKPTKDLLPNFAIDLCHEFRTWFLEAC